MSESKPLEVWIEESGLSQLYRDIQIHCRELGEDAPRYVMTSFRDTIDAERAAREEAGKGFQHIMDCYTKRWKPEIENLRTENARLAAEVKKYKEGFWGRATSRMITERDKLAAALEDVENDILRIKEERDQLAAALDRARVRGWDKINADMDTIIADLENKAALDGREG